MLVVEAWLVWRSKADWGFERRYESDNLIAAWATPHFSPLASHLRMHNRICASGVGHILRSCILGAGGAVRCDLQEFTMRSTQLEKLSVPWRYPERHAQ
jgi:hypothetical protein